jgi:hypothetical protein
VDADEGTCSQHHDARARAVCTGCERRLCGGCLELAIDSADEHCAYCHAIARPLAAVRRPPAPSAPPPSASVASPSASAPRRPPSLPPPAAVVTKGGTSALPDESWLATITSYVFARDTLLVLAGLAAITAVLRWMAVGSFGPGRTIAWIMAAGLEASYYFHIVVDSGGGSKHLESPDFSSVYDDMVEPLKRYLLTLVPIAAAIIWYGVKLSHEWSAGIVAFEDSPHSIFDYAGPGALFAAGLALWPLMTVIAALGRSAIAAYNPIAWVQTLRLFGTRYIAGAVVVYALLVAEAYLVPALAPLRHAPIVGAFAIQFVAVIAMALRARVLGYVCEPYFK